MDLASAFTGSPLHTGAYFHGSHFGGPSITGPNAYTAAKDESKVKLVTKDLKAMGLAAGGKLGIFKSLDFRPIGHDTLYSDPLHDTLTLL